MDKTKFTGAIKQVRDVWSAAYGENSTFPLYHSFLADLSEIERLALEGNLEKAEELVSSHYRWAHGQTYYVDLRGQYFFDLRDRLADVCNTLREELGMELLIPE